MGSKLLNRYGTVVSMLAMALLGGCGNGDDVQVARPSGVPITLSEVSPRDVRVSEFSVGRVESLANPFIAAEVEGRILEIRVQIGDPVTEGQVLAVIDPGDYELAIESASADIGRLGALIDQQTRLVERYKKLQEDKFFSENALDEARAQLRALNKQLAAARAGLQQARRDLRRTQILAPLSGKVEQRLVSAGDYVQRGGALFRLSTDNMLRVVLPFPESLANRLAVGQRVILESPALPGKPVEKPITELRPTVGSNNRAMEALVDMENPGGWKVGASVNAELILEVHESAATVPEICVVVRPAGQVVYVYEEAEGVVAERSVAIGVRRDGWVEILDGLELGEKVASDGAAFLSDRAKVRFADTEE